MILNIPNDKKNVYHVNEDIERRRLSYAFQYVICVIFDSVAPRVADNYIIYNLKTVLQPKTSPNIIKRQKLRSRNYKNLL